MDWMTNWGEAALTALGFFWKAGWAFVLGYAISAIIQAFVPKARLTRYMGDASLRSVSIASFFGAASSSCSFAALGAARALVMKGASFVAAVAFMFASTNLVIELGILIVIFLGWSYLAAELVGGLLLIVISSLLIRLTGPEGWFEAARRHVEQHAGGEEDDFDWRERISSRAGWALVGQRFIDDWKMVWQEILIGFTVAGFVATLVPAEFWEALFLANREGVPEWLRALENAMVAPFVAAATFIGSMGNIPLATVLNANGVLFAGIMGFIYSDLMVPPLVMINAKYYGWRVALYIAGVMYVSIIITALAMHGAFSLLGIELHSGRAVEDVVRFKLDYTLFLNILGALLAVTLVWMSRGHEADDGHDMDMGGGRIKSAFALLAGATLAVGLLGRIWT